MKIDIPARIVGEEWQKPLLDAVAWVSGVDTDLERCGFFWQDDQAKIHFKAMHNTAHDPESSFSYSAHDAWEFIVGQPNASMVGMFHSHPGGSAAPSGTDMHMALQMEGSMWGSGFLHWLLAIHSDGTQTLMSYDETGPIRQLRGRVVLDGEVE